MKETDYLSLDGHSMHIFLTVLEQGSLASAAEKLGMTKTVIGNSLTKLRSVFHDPLFVRSGGQEIVATPRAYSLAAGMRDVLSGMQQLTLERTFTPQQANLTFTIGTNAFLRDVILPAWYRQVAAEAKAFSLRTLIAEYPAVEWLRSGKADLLLSPHAPEGSDIVSKRLFIDQQRCFFDASVRSQPRTLADFRQARYLGLTPVAGQRTSPLAAPIARELEQQVVMRVPHFADMANLLRGTDLLALAPGMLRLGALAEFASMKLPFTLPPVFIFMLWHQRQQNDPAHQWVRTCLEAAVSHVLARSKLAAEGLRHAAQ